MKIKIFLILLVLVSPFVLTGVLDELTFSITALAFLTGAMAIILQKEAIEFLASKGVPLSGIDLSAETHGGFVYLQGLFKDFTGDRSKINLINANFSGANCGANLMEADFTSANLSFAEFSNAMIKKAKFNRANLTRVDFSSSYYFNEAEFTDNYINHKINHENGKSTDADLPKAPQGYKFELDKIVDENGKPIYPLNDKKYRFIKFIKLAKE